METEISTDKPPTPSMGSQWVDYADAARAGMPTWEAPAGRSSDTPHRAAAELGYLLEAIEMPESGLGDDIELGSQFINPNRPASQRIPDSEWEMAQEADAENFGRVLQVAHAVERRLGWMAEHFPPEAMEYIRHVVGLKLVERFEALARNERRVVNSAE